MMSMRQQFISYVRQGGPPLASPQIGAGAGFDTRLAGKRWISETTLEDTLAAVSRFNMVPLINIGCDPAAGCPDLAWQRVDLPDQNGRRSWRTVLQTPYGELSRHFLEEPVQGTVMTKYPVSDDSDLPAFEWYLDRTIESDFKAVEASLNRQVRQIGGRAAVSVQWGAQPYELFSFANTVDTVLLAHDEPQTFQCLMDKILRIDQELIAAVRRADADFVLLGGPGSEMLSPDYYRNYIIPYSQRVSQLAHDQDLLVYCHICSPIEPFLSMGFYNQMGIDLFETLSEAPVGNVKSLADALDKLDPSICTRGNIGLDVLLHGSQQEVVERVLTCLEQAGGRKHMVAASDYLFYDVPEASVAALCDTVVPKRMS